MGSQAHCSHTFTVPFSAIELARKAGPKIGTGLKIGSPVEEETDNRTYTAKLFLELKSDCYIYSNSLLKGVP